MRFGLPSRHAGLRDIFHPYLVVHGAGGVVTDGNTLEKVDQLVYSMSFGGKRIDYAIGQL